MLVSRGAILCSITAVGLAAVRYPWSLVVMWPWRKYFWQQWPPVRIARMERHSNE